MIDPQLTAQVNKLIGRVDSTEKDCLSTNRKIDNNQTELTRFIQQTVPITESGKVLELTGDIVLKDTDPVLLFIDPGGSARDVQLPPAGRNNHLIIIANTADAAENLVVKDVDDNVIAVIGQDDQGVFVSDGDSWCLVTDRIIYQNADSEGLEIYGYDDKSTSCVKISLDNLGTANISPSGPITISTSADYDIRLNPLYGDIVLAGYTKAYGDIQYAGDYHPVYNRGSDVDHRIWEVSVTGTPYMMWDESADNHYTNKGMRIANTQIESANIEVNRYGSGNRYAYIDLVGDGTYSDYGLRLVRYNTGANAISELKHRGTSSLKISTIEAAAMYFYTNNSIRLSIESSGHVYPRGTAGTQNLGNATYYWNDVSYKTLTDRGCLGWYEDGVELQDGRIVSDIEALKSIKKHKTLLTVAGAPRLDYSTMPKHVYKPAPLARKDVYAEEHKALEDSPKTGKPRYKTHRKLLHKKGEKAGEDGAELTALVSIMLGAIKELDSRLLEIEIKQ